MGSDRRPPLRPSHRDRCLVRHRDSGIPLHPPVVSASSTSYYWTQPFFYLVCVPAGEPGSLLGLPDLAHELGHLLYPTEFRDCASEVALEVAQWFDNAARLAVLNETGQAAGLRNAKHQWTESWLEEFFCDAFAAHLFGRAYGFQHVRLCVLRGSDPWTPGLGERNTHPADEARLRVIVAILLEETGRQGPRRVEALWYEFAAAHRGRKSPGYELCYPAELIELVAKETG
jgi:hypothetical protein